MLKKLSNQHLEKLLFHSVDINNILTEALFLQQGKELPFELGDKTQSVETSLNDPVCSQRENDLNRLCGRWKSGNVRCGFEISRVGEHFILTFLKRNGSPTDERYILMWLDGDIFYYGYQDRMTILALNTQSDILMLSPGVDYTRVPKDEIK